jgi:hypothetical protein
MDRIPNDAMNRWFHEFMRHWVSTERPNKDAAPAIALTEVPAPP